MSLGELIFHSFMQRQQQITLLNDMFHSLVSDRPAVFSCLRSRYRRVLDHSLIVRVLIGDAPCSLLFGATSYNGTNAM
jgi:hypothetical protein